MFDLHSIQASIKEFRLDGWLLYDFRGSNGPARRVLGLDDKPVGSRRFFYMIPSNGPALKLVHAIEPKALEHLPGETSIYRSWPELEQGLVHLTDGACRIAMEYAPNLSNPYISRVDGGTIEAVRRLGVEIASSGDLIQLYEAALDDDQWRMHLDAEKVTTSAFEVAWGLIADRTRDGGAVRESEVQAAILNHFEQHHVTTYSPPNVSVGPHSGDPHYEPGLGGDGIIRPGEFVLIDLWGKLKKPRSIYSDLTRVGFVGPSVPEKYETVFQIVAGARDAAIACIREAFAAERPLHGFEVDDAAREVTRRAGFESHFTHRTGHSIGQEVHGNGANMDNLETHDERLVLPRTCFSIEPGLYFEEFGVRSEINVFVDSKKVVHVTGGLQRSVVPILG